LKTQKHQLLLGQALLFSPHQPFRFYGPQVDFVQGCQDCLDFVLECGATVLNADTAEAALCDCKASAGQLTMPVAKERVPHEDSLLSVENFLKQAVTS
jgi:hypothetical protein